MTQEIKPLTEKTLTVFCAIFDFSRGVADITCPVSDSPTACLRALERRGLIVWDTERNRGKTKRYAALTALGAAYGCETLALALAPMGISSGRNRQWVRVQFDLNDEDYQEAYRIAGDLAQARLLAPTIRDLLQIHEAADKGDYSLFYQLYGIPETKETSQFETMIQTFADMQRTIDTLTAKLDRLQNAPQLQPSAPARDLQPVAVSTQANGPKTLQVPQFEVKAPVFDDDEDMDDLLVVKKDEGAALRASLNFIESMKRLTENETKADPKALSRRQRGD